MSEQVNPILEYGFRIPFHRIQPEHVRPGVRAVLSDADEAITALINDCTPPTYENTVERLDSITERVKERMTVVTHLLSVAESPEMRAAYNEVLPEIADFWTRLPLNEGLWSHLKACAGSEEGGALQGIRRRHLDTLVREFRRAGADLEGKDRDRLKEINVEISQLQQRFSENVLDATNAFRLVVKDGGRLDGVPVADKDEARRKAEAAGEKGWLLTLDYPSFEPILKYATDRSLREELYLAFVMRCRDGEFGNVTTIQRLLELRREVADLLGYEHFPDYRLEEAMAKTGAAAIEFTEQLTERTQPYWERDVRALEDHAATLQIDRLEPWDVAFVSEHLRRVRYDIDDEVIRPYFPLDKVLSGLFEIVHRVFGLQVRERKVSEVWHEDVRYCDLLDQDGTHLGSFYADWHPRPEKRHGAWMSDMITGRVGPDGSMSPHLGVIAGNLTPAKGDIPSLLTHREVQTIFHEFGHLLHHLTTTVVVAPRAGINVAWDFVELPSQLMENWTWERDALALISGHYETGEPLPDALYERIVEARRFMGGWAQMRQLSFGYSDLKLHLEYSSEEDGDVLPYVETLLERYSVRPGFSHYHNMASFTHLFAGGYAAAYYSYLWSEVLEADAFSRFKEEGIFSQSVGREYVDKILSRGDSAEPEDLFRDFLGRDPDPQALLERNLGALAEEVGV